MGVRGSLHSEESLSNYTSPRTKTTRTQTLSLLFLSLHSTNQQPRNNCGHGTELGEGVAVRRDGCHPQGEERGCIGAGGASGESGAADGTDHGGGGADRVRRGASVAEIFRPEFSQGAGAAGADDCEDGAGNR